MPLTLDKISKETGKPKKELIIQTVLSLYQKGELSLNKMYELVGLNVSKFKDLLVKNGIVVDEEVYEYIEDMENFDKIKNIYNLK